MAHGATNNMDDFKKVCKELDIVSNLVQLPVDGTNVNWAFLDTLENCCKGEDPNAPSLLNKGSCGLHVLRGAYKTGRNKVDCDVDKTLKAVHVIFEHSAVRRADCLADNNITDQHHDQAVKFFFPVKLCGHRWLKNGKVIIRFMEISEKVATYLTQSKKTEDSVSKG